MWYNFCAKFPWYVKWPLLAIGGAALVVVWLYEDEFRAWAKEQLVCAGGSPMTLPVADLIFWTVFLSVVAVTCFALLTVVTPLFRSRSKGRKLVLELIEEGRFLANEKNISHDPHHEREAWYEKACSILEKYFPEKVAGFKAVHGEDWDRKSHRQVLLDEVAWLRRHVLENGVTLTNQSDAQPVPDLSSALTVNFMPGSEKYSRARRDGWRTYALALENKSDTTLRGARVRLSRLDPSAKALRGSLPLPMKFRDHDRNVRQLDIQPHSIEYVDLVSYDSSKDSLELPNFRIEHTAEAPLSILGSEDAEKMEFTDEQGNADRYDFDLEITAERFSRPIQETFTVRIDTENDRVTLRRQEKR